MNLKEEFDRLGVRDEVLAFAMQMEFLLRENDEKGGWTHDPIPHLIKRLKGEVEELEEAFAKYGHCDEVCREAGDVGNFAMMIYDVSLGSEAWHRKVRRLSATIPPETIANRLYAMNR